MPKAETSNSNDGPSYQGTRYRPNWLAAVLCFVLGPSLTVALVDYRPAQVTFNTTHPTTTNIVGTFGADTAWCLYWTFGLAAWLVPAFLLLILFFAIWHPRRISAPRLVAMLVCVLAISGLAAMVSFKPNEWFPHALGGFIGKLLYHRLLSDTFGLFGSGLLLATLSSCGFVFVLAKDIGVELERLVESFHQWREARARHKQELAEARAKAKADAEKARADAAKAKSAAPAAASVTAAPQPPPSIGPAAKKIVVPKNADDPLAKPPPPPPPSSSSSTTAPALKLAPPARPSANTPGATATPPPPTAPVIHKPVAPPKAAAELPPNDEDYKRFTLTLLKEQINPADDSDEEHMRNMADLVRILGEFGVEVSPGEIHVGPVITCYEVVPAAGVRVEKISGLDKNIALGMRAQSVRILAPIPGKAAVGVEIPNRQPTPVGMREILESPDWRGVRAEIPIALGKDVSGTPLISDLTKMPHLLIAGATGSGKSVCINSIIASVIYRKSPRDVRLIMVDPKVVELKIFNVLPHMLIPVVTEPKKVPGALKWLLGEMEQRYQQFAKVGVRNITGFNNRKKNPAPDEPPPSAIQGEIPLNPADDVEIPDHLPYIVVIIDELADLMMVAPAEIETSIARLAQLARAAGIHLIIATQRPSVNVITGVIKANLPSRIAFQVASQVDSRTILDVKGADTLIGRGDMLFSPPGSSRLVRAQGAFVSDDEIQTVVKFIKENNQPPVYAHDVQAHIDRAASEDDEDLADGDDEDLGDDEELYRQAIDVLKSSRRASTSMLQRRLRIGYNRAARLMEIMEEKGIVGPENGSAPREILVDLDSL